MNATPARPDGTVELTIGFTKSDRSIDYSSYDDGYRPGARQELVTLTVNARGLPEMTAAQWGDAVFEATNAPGVSDPAARRIAEAISVAQQAGQARRMRSLSVGDTVTVNGTERVSCEKRNWAPAPLDAEAAPEMRRGDLVKPEGSSGGAYRVVSVERGGAVPLAFIVPAAVGTPGDGDGSWWAVSSLVNVSALAGSPE